MDEKKPDKPKINAPNREAEIAMGLRSIDDDPLPETNDMKELARSAVPRLVRKAIALAQKTERLGDVVAVLKELADRGYGKPAQSVEHSGKIEHVTLVLNRNGPVIDNAAPEIKVIEEKK